MITTGIFPPDIGGPATYVPRFGDFLSSNGFKVEIVTLSEKMATNSSHFPFSVQRIKRSRRRSLRMIITVASIAKKLKTADYLFCNGLYLETALAMRLSFFNGHSLVKIVGDPVWERARNRGREKISVFGRIERRLITWSLEQFDRVTCPGENLARVVKSWSSKISVDVIHNGVHIFEQRTDNSKKYDLVVISRLVPWKNVDAVISIAKELNCTLVVIGDGPERESLQNQALGNTNISFLGTCTTEEIESLLAQSRVFCQLSDYEGLSFSLLQAMSSGLPCVLSDIEANRAVFNSDQDAAIFLQTGNHQQNLEEVSKILGSPELQKNMGIRAQEIVKRYFDERERMKEMMELLTKYD